MRVKGELIDTPGDATALMKTWDQKTQELVLTVSMGSFSEVYRVVPERQNQGAFVFPKPQSQPQDAEDTEPKRTGSTILDDEKLSKLERLLTKRRVAAMMADELKKRGQQQ